MLRKKLIVCDVDNTLYDWVSYFVPSFYTMVDKVIEMTGWSRDQLLDDFRKVHQAHGDSEHPFALLETECVRRGFPNKSTKELLQIFDPAFHAFNSMRKETLKLFPTVRDTLRELQARDIRLVAHTESKLFAVLDRLSRLDLTSYFEAIYCSTRSDSPHPRGAPQLALPDEVLSRVRELSHHQRKPDGSVLVEICRNADADPSEAAYIGDSIARDVMMAKGVGVYAIWAAYGSQHDKNQYDLLVRISHWTTADVQREKRLAQAALAIKPDFIAKSTFSEILNADL